MSGAHRTGVNLEPRLAELEHDLELAHAELVNLETEHERYRACLAKIASAESGVWGWYARDALHPSADDEGAA